MTTIAKLIPIVNTNALSIIEIKQNNFTLGRLHTCNHVFDDIRTSSKHAIIHYNSSNKSFILQDNATNGTYLHNKKIGKGNKHPLKNNDIIQFVRTKLEYKFVIISSKPKINNVSMLSLDPLANNNNNNNISNVSMLSLDPFESMANIEPSLQQPTRKRKQSWSDDDNNNNNTIKHETEPIKKKRKLNLNDEIVPLEQTNSLNIFENNNNKNVSNNTNNNEIKEDKKEKDENKKKDKKVNKSKVSKRMRAQDARNLNIDIKSGGLFDGVISLIIAKKSRRLDIIMEKFIENGGEVYDEMDVNDNYDIINDINTIIMNNTMPFVKLTKAIKNEKIVLKFHIVTLEWISSCMQHNKILNTRKYIPKCLKNNNNINIKEVNKSECPAKQSMDMNDKENDDDEFDIKEEMEQKQNELNYNNKVIDSDASDFEENDEIIAKSTQKKDDYIIEQVEDKILIIKHKDWKSSNNIAAFDMDGTLIRTQSGNKFPKNWKDFQLLYDYSFKMEKKIMEYYNKNYSFVVFSNQKISHLKNKKPATYHQKIFDLKQKIPAIFKHITVKGSNKIIPFCYVAALSDDIYRKPHRGMFEYFNTNINLRNETQLKHMFYVGDAAGREKGWKNGRIGHADFSSSDRAFAANCKLPFFTPEEFFLNAPKCQKFRLMDLKGVLKTAKSNKYPSELVNINGNEQYMVLFIGYPGSGKTTLFRRFFYGHGFKHINCDTLGSMEKCQIECKKYLQQKYSVVIDNTNPSKMARKRFMVIGKTMRVKVGCIWMQCERSLAYHLNVIRWRMNSGNKKIPVMAYKKYDKEFSKPQSIEGFEWIVKVPFVFDKELYDESEFLLHT